MISAINKKNRIDLTDYPFEKELENRFLLSSLNQYEVEILEEILNGPIRITVSSLLEEIGGEAEDLVKAIEKFGAAGLLKLENGILTIDKEARKYFDFHIQKFDSQFTAGMDYIQWIMARVPIQSLTNWYTLPRTADNILDAIMEKCFLTPQVYKQHLAEISFENPILSNIVQEIKNPVQPIKTRALMEKYGITPREMQLYILHLEFNFICCSAYISSGLGWDEVLKPFQWWSEYLQTCQDLVPSFCQMGNLDSTDELPFIESLTEAIENKDFSSETHRQCLSSCGLMLFSEGNPPQITPLGTEWLSQSKTEKALFFHRHPAMSRIWNPSILCRLERSLHALSKGGKNVWISLDNFLFCYNLISGAVERHAIKKEGRKWIYSLPRSPTYDEPALIIRCLKAKFFQSGIINIASDASGIDYIQLTNFGRKTLGA